MRDLSRDLSLDLRDWRPDLRLFRPRDWRPDLRLFRPRDLLRDLRDRLRRDSLRDRDLAICVGFFLKSFQKMQVSVCVFILSQTI